MDASQLSSVICSTCLQIFLSSVSAPHPSSAEGAASLEGCGGLLSDTAPNPHLALHSLDSSIHQPVYLLWTHSSLQLWFLKVSLKMSASLWNSRSLTFTHPLLHDRDAQVHYPRLLRSKISSFERPSRLKQLFLYLCHLATTRWDRWGTQHVLFP